MEQVLVLGVLGGGVVWGHAKITWSEAKGAEGGEKGEGGRGTRHRTEGRGTVKYSKTRCINVREKTRHDVYEYRPDQYNKGSPASASVDRKSFFFRNILQRMGHWILSCAIGWLHYRRIRLSSRRRGKIENALSSPISLPTTPPQSSEENAYKNASREREP